MKGQVCLGLFVAISSASTALYGQGGDSHAVTAEQYARWKTELSNWGRWGAADEIGTGHGRRGPAQPRS